MFAVLVSENFAQPALGAISDDGAAELARGDDAQPVAATRVGLCEHGHVPRRHTAAMVLHRREFMASSKPDRWREFGRHGARSVQTHTSARADGQPLPAFGATPLEHDAAVLGPHPDHKSMGPPTAAAIGLKSALHRN